MILMASNGHFFGQIPECLIRCFSLGIYCLTLEPTTSDAQALRNESNLGCRLDFDTQLAGLDHRTTSLAFYMCLLAVYRSAFCVGSRHTLTTFLWLALVAIDNGDTGELVRHDCGEMREDCMGV